MAGSVIDQLRESDNALVRATAKDYSKWSKLKHTKQDLELLLSFNIAEIRFRPKDQKEYVKAVVTGNQRFIKVYKAVKKKDKVKMAASSFAGLKTKDPGSVLAYDLVEKKFKTVVLESWQIVNFITLSEDNVLVLDELVRDCLRR